MATFIASKCWVRICARIPIWLFFRGGTAQLIRKKNIHDKQNQDGYTQQMNTMDKILQEASHLPEDQRLTLAHRLLTIDEPVPSDELRHTWDVEIRDRIARYDRGETGSRPAGEVFSELDRRLQA
jgi:hypothetical protein